MPTTRISDPDHRLLQRLARQTGKQHQQIIREALDIYQREWLLDEINGGFARLRSENSEWAAEQRERELWNNTLADEISE